MSTQPTDDEIKALLPTVSLARNEEPKVQVWLTQKDAIAFARAVLAKWGTPATGGEPAGTVGYTVHGTQYVNWRTKPPAHGTTLYTSPQPVREPLDAAALAQRAKVGAIQTDHNDNVVLRRAEYRSQMEGRFERGWREAEKYRGIKGGQHGNE